MTTHKKYNRREEKKILENDRQEFLSSNARDGRNCIVSPQTPVADAFGSEDGLSEVPIMFQGRWYGEEDLQEAE